MSVPSRASASSDSMDELALLTMPDQANVSRNFVWQFWVSGRGAAGHDA